MNGSIRSVMSSDIDDDGFVVPLPLQDDKTSFFNELDCLNESSDEDEDSEVNYLRKASLAKPLTPTSSFSIVPEAIPCSPNRAISITKKVPAIRRTTSAPVRTVVAETPVLERTTSLLRFDISVEATPETSFTTDDPATQAQPADKPLAERRSVSTPSIGSVSMTNSLGIANMLKKKQPRKEDTKAQKGTKRKASLLEMKPEEERIFNEKVFYYIPDDDVASLRKTRINKARSYGASWTREWNSSVTHVIVDSNLTYDQITKWLREQRGVALIPPDCIVVRDTYPLDCIKWSRLLDHNQAVYKILGDELSLPKKQPEPEPIIEEQESLKIKDREFVMAETTPSQSDYSQASSKPVIPQPLTDHGTATERPHQASDSSPAMELRTFGDALDEIIKDAMRMPNLDADDDRSTPGATPEDVEESGSEGERALQHTRNKKRRVVKGSLNQASFSCMKGGTGVALDSNPNKRTIELLQAMADYYDRIKDQWRTLSYRKAIGTLKQQTQKISTYEEAIALSTIGERLAKKIEEIVQTDRLQKLDYALADSDDKTLQLFMGVYGAGVSQAEKWIKAGHKTLDDLVKHNVLNTNQKIGVEHYDHFNTRIPRDEVTALGEIVRNAALEIDSNVEVIIGGSYRRGASSSGDIDCLITKAGTVSSNDLLKFLHNLVNHLTNACFLVAALAVPSSHDDSGSKWHGVCVLPQSPEQIWRRIDFLLVPSTEFGAALIYFTGNDIFNRSLRLLASKKHMRLNQRGLYKDVMRGTGRVKLSEGTLVEGADEKRIFEILGVPWRRPEDRIP